MLLFLEVRATLLDLLFIFGARFMDFLFGFQHHFAFFIFCAFDGIIDDALCFFFRTGDLTLGDFFPVKHTNQKKDDCADQNPNNDKNNLQSFHSFSTHLLTFNFGIVKTMNQ